MTYDINNLDKFDEEFKKEFNWLNGIESAGVIIVISKIADWWKSKMKQDRQEAYNAGRQSVIDEIEVSCVRDSLLGKSDEYLRGWNECSEEWRRVRNNLK
jgi:hypothetical protein